MALCLSATKGSHGALFATKGSHGSLSVRHQGQSWLSVRNQVCPRPMAARALCPRPRAAIALCPLPRASYSSLSVRDQRQSMALCLSPLKGAHGALSVRDQRQSVHGALSARSVPTHVFQRGIEARGGMQQRLTYLLRALHGVNLKVSAPSRIQRRAEMDSTSAVRSGKTATHTATSPVWGVLAGKAEQGGVCVCVCVCERWSDWTIGSSRGEREIEGRGGEMEGSNVS
jgi:hypothetical protein